MRILKNNFILGTFIILLSACSGSGGDDDFISTPPDGGGTGGGNTLRLVPEILVPSGFIVEEFATGLNLPTTIAFPPDGSNRLFINELQSGRVRIVQNGTLNVLPFVDLETMVTGGFPSEGENGLIGLAFDPDYAINRYVYVSFAVRTPGGTIGKVARMKDQSNRATDFEVILDNLPSAAGHQIETIAFGLDGKLYVSVGDAFEDAKAQDLNEFNGKILRMNPDGTIPSDNPDSNSYVWASGLRNSFGLVFSSNGTLYASENGPNEKDELNVISKANNYGWPTVLGNSSDPNFTNPIHVWNNIVAPTSMVFNNGTNFPDKYKNKMFIVLFGRTFSDGPDPISKRVQVATIQNAGPDATISFEDFATYNFFGKGNPIGVTVDSNGFLFLSDIFQGKIFRIRFGTSGVPL
jgi:glucose/arabinose dehydrogenase